jgi:hypothetical protein
VTARQYLELSTKLVGDLQHWLLESAEHGTLRESDLETLQLASKIVERVTLGEAQTRADAEPEQGTIVI